MGRDEFQGISNVKTLNKCHCAPSYYTMTQYHDSIIRDSYCPA
jgi:hypothetical protein